MNRIDDKELFISLAKDFANAVKEYRKASDDSEIIKSRFLSDEESDKEYLKYQSRINGLTTSKDYISLTREEYWQEIIKTKIEVIAAIGGFKFMQEFHNFLYECNEYDELRLSTAFDYYADGICGWCR